MLLWVSQNLGIILKYLKRNTLMDNLLYLERKCGTKV